MTDIEVEFNLFWLLHFRIRITPSGTRIEKRQPYEDNVITKLIDELQDGSKPATKNDLEQTG